LKPNEIVQAECSHLIKNGGYYLAYCPVPHELPCMPDEVCTADSKVLQHRIDPSKLFTFVEPFPGDKLQTARPHSSSRTSRLTGSGIMSQFHFLADDTPKSSRQAPLLNFASSSSDQIIDSKNNNRDALNFASSSSDQIIDSKNKNNNRDALNDESTSTSRHHNKRISLPFFNHSKQSASRKTTLPHPLQSITTTTSTSPLSLPSPLPSQSGALSPNSGTNYNNIEKIQTSHSFSNSFDQSLKSKEPTNKNEKNNYENPNTNKNEQFGFKNVPNETDLGNNDEDDSFVFEKRSGVLSVILSVSPTGEPHRNNNINDIPPLPKKDVKEVAQQIKNQTLEKLKNRPPKKTPSETPNENGQ